MKKVLYILLVLCFSVGFASCSSSDEDGTHLSTDCESIKVSSKFLNSTFKIKTGEAWSIINNSDWVKIEKMSGIGDAEINFLCDTNDSDKERKATITIKTASSSKEISIIQTGIIYFKPGPFARFKSAKGVVDYVVDKNVIIPFRSGPIKIDDKAPELMYLGNRDKRPELRVILKVAEEPGQIPWDPAMTIFLNDAIENMTIEDAKESFLKPHCIYLGGVDFVDSNFSNINNENLKISRNGNIISYTFKNFKANNPYPSEHDFHVINGTLEFELID